MAGPISCPFCGYESGSEYNVQLHIEERHTDDSPFVPEPERPKKVSRLSKTSNASSKGTSSSGTSSMPEDMWTRCTRPGCGEHVLLSEIDEHLDLHAAAALAEQDEERPPALPPRRSPPRRPAEKEASSKTRELLPPSPRKLEKGRAKSPGKTASILSFFSGTSTHGRSTTVRRIHEPKAPGRLGKKELGPHAFEKRMPDDVREHLIHGAKPQYVQRISRSGRLVREAYVPNETVGLIPILADLCSLEEDTRATYFCHPCVRHIQKLQCDGNFCGYWNIQVLLTYIQHMMPQGPQELPNIIQIQKTIEKAWDQGILSFGRTETGGILDTRKWIGTQEALAFFNRINVKAEALVVKAEALVVKAGDGDGDKIPATELLDYVEAYFMSATDTAKRHGTSYTTQLAPIYFQRVGHSMTIVGIERKDDGSRNLLVFDSSFATSKPMENVLDGRRARSSVPDMLRPYRRSELSLTKWDEFELLIPHPIVDAEMASAI
ncbi:hypothetical protein M409DRAFT_26115 [Zasmidium cellare ATCC 36951]|uniref:UBZ3-type domain-containing protein n=1 Tax=Zasmidium cellare ATCC 36951 TaxID=1080233 RepID=A0A6A6C9K7_ZASCE|nr:uncharacterized protein M409DRAFT_26115 [Zasmidium cellare ATCC 36951]KAF2163503.1 hypothetical protein M409DRAFT_26115 [Zasmidium cellare ATCC 36951]